MLEESLKIFLDLIRQIDAEAIENEILMQGAQKSKDQHTLSFKEIYAEIQDVLIRASIRPDAKEQMWFDTLRTLFKFLEGKDAAQNSKSRMIHDFIYRKISDLMQLMSEYVDFEKVVDVLLDIDPNARYCYSKDWFKNLYISKNDQELLYTSAKRLLSNENSSLIDSIIEKNNAGFIGERDKQKCALCNLNLGGFVNDCAFILTQCDHKFHSKCFFEEIKNRRIMEGKKDNDFKPECPICKKHHIEFDEKKKSQGGSKRKGRRRGERKVTEDEPKGDSDEDEMSSHPLMEKRAPIRTMEQYEREYKHMDEDVYKQKLKAFDEDFAASQLEFTLD